MKCLRPVLLALVGFAALAALPAESNPGLKLGALKGPSGIGLIHLFENPPALPGGGKLEPIAVASADLMAAKLISGEYDAAVLPVNMAAKLRSAGIPLVLSAIVGNGMVSFLSFDGSPATVEGLKGAEVSVAGQGATPDYLFRKILIDAGLDPAKDLKLSYALPYPEAAVALASGKIRYAVLPEPFATLALLSNPALKESLDLDTLWKEATGREGYPMTALVVTEKALKSSPEALKVMLGAVKASIEAVQADPAAAGLLVEKHDLGLKAAVAAKAIPRSNYVYREARAARPEVEALLRIFLDLAPASVGGKLPDDAFYASF